MSITPPISAETELSGAVIGLFAGKPQTLWPGKPPSAIAKTAVEGPVEIDADGFTQDEQADLKVHGGPEKAIHHYPAEHMAFWRAQFPDHAGVFKPGCFGENVSTTALTEHNLCIGDVLILGSATVQITQGRQPCWKLSAHIGLKEMVARFQKTGRTGWYYRVLENGSVVTGDTMRLIDRPHPDWSVHRVTQARFDSRLDPAIARELSDLDALSENWRAAFARKSDRAYVENTDVRLKGGD